MTIDARGHPFAAALWRSLTATAALLLTACSLRAGFAGFEAGNGVALTGGVVGVTFMANKSHTIRLGRGLRLTIMEVQITMVDGTVKRHTMVFAGTHTFHAPLPIEIVAILGPLCVLGLLCGLIVSLSLLSRHGEPRAPPDASSAAPVGESGEAKQDL